MSKPASSRYRSSEEMLARALRTIPLGSQTFSKSRTQYPHGVSPFFAQKAKGARLWDVDGNEYIDFVCSLASVTLGYNDPDVTNAVRAQLEDGVIFSLPHPLEHQVAELVCEMVPCAQRVRFGKNGSDATSGAIRIARAFTGRDRVAVCGYHGWQDWYIGSTLRNRGVPQATRELTHTFAFNDVQALATLFRERPGQFAAVILEPMNVTYPAAGFLEGVRELCTKEGVVLVFDETITGFRFANGGAQAMFGVTPDLATFGKGLANGYPVSAVCGRADIMQLMEEVFFSFTFGGETLSLAAAKATLEKLKREPVVSTIRARGTRLLDGVKARVDKYGVGELLGTGGDPAWSFLLFKEPPPKDGATYTSWQVKTLFLQEVFARGLLTIGTHNMSYAHGDAEVDRALQVYDEVFPILRSAVNDRQMASLLKVPALEPLFKVR